MIRELAVGRGRQDPFSWYHALRALAPVHRSDLDGVWYVSSYAACRDLLLDRRTGKSESGTGRLTRFGVDPAFTQRFTDRRFRNMITTNPPEHTRLRNAARGPFMPGRMEGRLKARVEAAVAALLAPLGAKGEADLVADVALPLPLVIIGELLGVPRDDLGALPPLINEFFAAHRAGATTEGLERADCARERLRSYFEGLVERERRAPSADLIGALVAEGGLDDEELYGTIELIFLAGYVTTTSLIGNGMLALFRHPAELAHVWATPELVGNAVDEMLRYDGPTQLVERTALEPIELDGHRIARGDGIVCLLGAANRDPAQFDHPDRYVATRPNAASHLGFSWGLHHCLGAPLAKLEVVTLFAQMRERFRLVELLDPAPPAQAAFGVRGVRALAMRFVER